MTFTLISFKNTVAKNPIDRDYVLDALRGIAAVGVVLFHITMDSKEPHYGLHLGKSGVQLFFLISGFVIYMSLSKTKSSKNFVISRFIRLYPTYWACVTFTFLLNAAYIFRHGELTATYFGNYLANMTMFQHYMGIDNLDPPYWTLIVEMVFYLTMLGFYRIGLLKRIEIIGSILATICFIIYAVIRLYSLEFYQTADFIYPLLNHFPLFLAGICFYLIKFEKSTLTRHIIIVCCFLASIPTFESLGGSYFFTYAEHILTIAFWFITFYLYIYGLLGWITNRFLVFLGTISYALYLVHQSISIKYLKPYFAHKIVGHPWIGNFITLAIVIAIASAITFWIEKPAARFLKLRLSAKNQN